MLKIYIVYTITIALILLLPLVLEYILLSKQDTDEEHVHNTLILAQVVVYTVILIHTCIVSLGFIITMRKKMYLYYDDHWKSLLLQTIGLLSFIGFNINHVLQNLIAEQFGTFGLEFIGIGLFTLSKIRDDFFILLNRDRTIIRISIFQKDYLAEVDPRLLAQIKVTGEYRELRDQIDEQRVRSLGLDRLREAGPMSQSIDSFIMAHLIETTSSKQAISNHSSSRIQPYQTTRTFDNLSIDTRGNLISRHTSTSINSTEIPSPTEGQTSRDSDCISRVSINREDNSQFNISLTD